MLKSDCEGENYTLQNTLPLNEVAVQIQKELAIQMSKTESMMAKMTIPPIRISPVAHHHLVTKIITWKTRTSR